MNSAFMYILECADGSYYTGSTKDLERRLCEHQNVLGANYTKKRLPVKLVYYEEYSRIDEAFYREKQVQGWSHNKKKALIDGCSIYLPLLSRNYTQFGKPVAAVASTSSATLPGVEHVETLIVPSSATDREKGIERVEVPCPANSATLPGIEHVEVPCPANSATLPGIEHVEVPCPANSATLPGIEHVEMPDTTEIKIVKRTDNSE